MVVDSKPNLDATPTSAVPGTGGRYTVRNEHDLLDIPEFAELFEQFVALRDLYQKELDRLFLPGSDTNPKVGPIKDKYEPRLNELYQAMLDLDIRHIADPAPHGS